MVYKTCCKQAERCQPVVWVLICFLDVQQGFERHSECGLHSSCWLPFQILLATAVAMLYKNTDHTSTVSSCRSLPVLAWAVLALHTFASCHCCSATQQQEMWAQ